MKRLLPALGLVLIAAALAATAGVGLNRLLSVGTSPVTLRSVTPGALEAAGVVLTALPVPPDCALPLHLSRCPIAKAQAEGAVGGRTRVAVPPVNGPFGTSIVEAVLTNAYVPGSASPSGVGVRGPAWVVATDVRAPVMCPVPFPSANVLVLQCGQVRRLVFVDAYSGTIRLTIARP